MDNDGHGGAILVPALCRKKMNEVRGYTLNGMRNKTYIESRYLLSFYVCNLHRIKVISLILCKFCYAMRRMPFKVYPLPSLLFFFRQSELLDCFSSILGDVGHPKGKKMPNLFQSGTFLASRCQVVPF